MNVNKVEILLKEGDIKGYGFFTEKPEKVLILIHGMGEHTGRYKRFIKKFNESNISVVSMDMRGNGNSIGPVGHCTPRSEVLSDVDQLIEATQKYNKNLPIFIYGHSMGGNIVLDYRRRGRYRKLLSGYVVSAPWVVLTRKVSLFKKVAVKIMAIINPEKTFSTGAGEGSRGAAMEKKGYKKDPLSHQLISYKCALDGFEIADSLYKGQGMEDASQAPMLIMHGTDDKMCHVDGSRKIVENEGDKCQLIIWEGRGHDLYRGKSAKEGNAVIEKMIQWVKEI